VGRRVRPHVGVSTRTRFGPVEADHLGVAAGHLGHGGLNGRPEPERLVDAPLQPSQQQPRLFHVGVPTPLCQPEQALVDDLPPRLSAVLMGNRRSRYTEGDDLESGIDEPLGKRSELRRPPFPAVHADRAATAHPSGRPAQGAPAHGERHPRRPRLDGALPMARRGPARMREEVAGAAGRPPRGQSTRDLVHAAHQRVRRHSHNLVPGPFS